jgi:hypothetical protein
MSATTADVILRNTVSFTPLADVCSNNNKLCQYWAKAGECTKNPAWMNVNCATSCKLCGKYEVAF